MEQPLIAGLSRVSRELVEILRHERVLQLYEYDIMLINY